MSTRVIKFAPEPHTPTDRTGAFGAASPATRLDSRPASDIGRTRPKVSGVLCNGDGPIGNVAANHSMAFAHTLIAYDRSLGYIEHADGTQVIKPTFREVRDHIAYAYQGKKGRA